MLVRTIFNIVLELNYMKQNGKWMGQLRTHGVWYFYAEKLRKRNRWIPLTWLGWSLNKFHHQQENIYQIPALPWNGSRGRFWTMAKPLVSIICQNSIQALHKPLTLGPQQNRRNQNSYISSPTQASNGIEMWWINSWASCYFSPINGNPVERAEDSRKLQRRDPQLWTC